MSILNKRTDRKNPVSCDNEDYRYTNKLFIDTKRGLHIFGIDKTKDGMKLVSPSEGNFGKHILDERIPNHIKVSVFKNKLLRCNSVYMKDDKVFSSFVNPMFNAYVIYRDDRKVEGGVFVKIVLLRFHNENIVRWVPFRYDVETKYLIRISKNNNDTYRDINDIYNDTYKHIKAVLIPDDIYKYLERIIKSIEIVYRQFYNGYIAGSKLKSDILEIEPLYLKNFHIIKKRYSASSELVLCDMKRKTPVKTTRNDVTTNYILYINSHGILEEMIVDKYRDHQYLKNVKNLYKTHSNVVLDKNLLNTYTKNNKRFDKLIVTDDYIVLGLYRPYNRLASNESYIFGQLVLTKNKLIEVLKDYLGFEIDKKGKVLNGKKLYGIKFFEDLYFTDILESKLSIQEYCDLAYNKLLDKINDFSNRLEDKNNEGQ